jgi:hypothetical protein
MTHPPARAQQPQTNGVHPEVRDFFQAASDTYHKKEGLEAENAELRNNLAVAEKMSDHLRAMLEKVTDDRDFHMQYSFALATGINSAQDVLNGLFEIAKRQAATPERLPEAPQLEIPRDTQ